MGGAERNPRVRSGGGRCSRCSGRVHVGARTRDGDTLGDPVSKCLADRVILARRRRTCDPSPRILRGGRGRWLRACPGRQWSRVFRRYGGTVPRAQGQLCCQHYGSGLDPIIRGSSATAYGARVWRRQEGFEAGSRCDGPGVEAVEVCCSPEPLIVVVVETSSRLAMSVGVSAMVGKQRCSSGEDVEGSLPGGLGVWGSSRPHLKAIT